MTAEQVTDAVAYHGEGRCGRITTSREGLGPGAEPLAGSLFGAMPGVTGPPRSRVRRMTDGAPRP